MRRGCRRGRFGCWSRGRSKLWNQTKLLRYITGRGGSGVGGLNAHLKTLDDDYDVLPIDADFLQRDIQGQIDTVREFILLDKADVVANSYGAYLLLLALIDQPPSNIRVLLLSPVLGRAISEERMLFSRPPREKTLRKAIAEQRLGMPDHLEILTGAKDEICDPALAQQVGEQLGISVSILHDEGHMLEPSSVERALSRFLSTQSAQP
jgi:pimeloyl-ACP methyl ester carboxylesterase